MVSNIVAAWSARSAAECFSHQSVWRQDEQQTATATDRDCLTAQSRTGIRAGVHLQNCLSLDAAFYCQHPCGWLRTVLGVSASQTQGLSRPVVVNFVVLSSQRLPLQPSCARIAISAYSIAARKYSMSACPWAGHSNSHQKHATHCRAYMCAVPPTPGRAVESALFHRMSLSDPKPAELTQEVTRSFPEAARHCCGRSCSHSGPQ